MEDYPKAKIPSSIPAGLTAEAAGRAAAVGKCARLGVECDGVCQPLNSDGTYNVQFDHVGAKSRGWGEGDNADDGFNIQLLCEVENSKKSNSPDVRYSGELYFDKPIELSALRANQLEQGYHLATDLYRDIFENPERVYGRFMLLAWLMGAGKTVGMLSVLFGINHVRKALGNGSARRVKRVLWLVHQSALVDSLAKEIRSELTSYGIAELNPKVVKVKNASHWRYDADVIVACPQAIWDVKNRKLTDQERREILDGFDAIIVDEAQFAIDHYLDLSRLAPRSFKFAVTATPMDKDGELFCDMRQGRYRNMFVLYSVFGYKPGFDAGIYKELKPFDEGFGSHYHCERGGLAKIRKGSDIEEQINTGEVNNLRREIAIVRKAIDAAKAADQNSDFKYSHQVMIRVGSKVAAAHIERAFSDSPIPTDRVVAVWSGRKGESLGSDNHPWMMTKLNNGQLSGPAARGVACVDMGQFGINNPYCSVIVWLEPNLSMNEIVQRLGRAIRHRPTMGEPAPIQVFWNGKNESFTEYLRLAIDYILNLEIKMGSFQGLEELTNEPPEIIADPIAAPVSPSDRMLIKSIAGELISGGEDRQKALSCAVQIAAEQRNWSENYIRKAERYSEKLDSDAGLLEDLNIPQIFTSKARIVISEEPESRDDSAISSALRSGTLFSEHALDVRRSMADRIDEGDETLIELCRGEMERIDKRARDIAALTLHDPSDILMASRKRQSELSEAGRPLTFKTYDEELRDWFLHVVKDQRELAKYTRQALYRAARKHFGFENFAKDTYQSFERELSDALMRAANRAPIIAFARWLLITDYKDKVPELSNIASLYGDLLLEADDEAA